MCYCQAPAPAPVVTGQRTAPGPRAGPALPATTSLTLDAAVTAPGCARAAVRDALAQWGLRHLTDPAEAITSELVANAVAASGEVAPGGAASAHIALSITVQPGELHIRVWDCDPIPPPRDYESGTWDETGRGLMIVTALSRRWDWCPAADGGKWVWAALSLPEVRR